MVRRPCCWPRELARVPPEALETRVRTTAESDARLGERATARFACPGPRRAYKGLREFLVMLESPASPQLETSRIASRGPSIS